MPKKEKTIDLSECKAEYRAERKRGRKVLKFLSFIFFIAVLAFAGYSYWNWQNTQKELKALSTIEGQQALVKKETDSVVQKLSRHIVLPTGEEPMLSVITDIDALKKDNPFYEGASNGDKILIYKEAKKGYIYDPKRDIIVNVGPVIEKVDESAAGTTKTETGTEKETTDKTTDALPKTIVPEGE